jgi:hypothetical protein
MRESRRKKLMPRFRLLGVGLSDLVWSGGASVEGGGKTSFNNFVQPTSIDHFRFRAYTSL